MTHETDTPPPLPGAATEPAATHADDVLAYAADLHCKASAAGVTIHSTLDVLRQGLAELPGAERWLDLLQFLQITLGNRQSVIDDALRALRAALTEGPGRGLVSASAHKPPTPNFPPYLVFLLDRAVSAPIQI